MVDNNQYHFGKPVLEYFPWNKYSDDINNMPTSNSTIINSFYNTLNFEDSSYRELSSRWIDGHISVRSDRYAETSYMYISRDTDTYKVSYLGIEETVYSWCDIEKIRLRILLGTKRKAENHIEALDFYNNYYDIIRDCIYLDFGKDINVEMYRGSIMNLNDSSLEKLITKEMVEDYLKKTDTFDRVASVFLSSVKSYLLKRGSISTRQYEAVRKISFEKILKTNNNLYFLIRDNYKRFDRISNYLVGLGLKTQKIDNLHLISKI